MLPEFELRTDPVLPQREFVVRLSVSCLTAMALIAVSLCIGMGGYHFLEHLSWLDSFLNASMLLGGMGPVDLPVTESGKLFEGLYALYCGLVVIFAAGIILAPVAHRVLHQFHMEADEQRKKE